ncbi:MAG: family 1 encapsulin nanocompartment shell protein [bacterium]
MSDRYLQRQEAPFGDKVWQSIDEAVAGAARSILTGRRLLHVEGPYGLGFKSLESEEVLLGDEAAEGVRLYASCPAAVIRIQAGFTLAARDIAAFEQTGAPLSLGSAARTALACARQEDALLFYGSETMGLRGLMNFPGVLSSGLRPWDSVGAAAEDILSAATRLDDAGFHGPFALALAPKRYYLLLRLYPQGTQTELEHVGRIVTEGIVKAPALSEGGLLLNAGRQFASIVLGQDLMTSFIGPEDGGYQLGISETVALRLTRPAAFCVLTG